MGGQANTGMISDNTLSMSSKPGISWSFARENIRELDIADVPRSLLLTTPLMLRS
jgi:hypothetical protein